LEIPHFRSHCIPNFSYPSTWIYYNYSTPNCTFCILFSDSTFCLKIFPSHQGWMEGIVSLKWFKINQNKNFKLHRKSFNRFSKFSISKNIHTTKNYTTGNCHLNSSVKINSNKSAKVLVKFSKLYLSHSCWLSPGSINAIPWYNRAQ
jgi:hypothetical protein